MIKYRLPEADFQKLLEEQRIWIKEKDAKVGNNEAARLTRERIDQLVEYLK